MKKILFICPYPFDVAAGQRLKFEPHFQGLKEKGFEIKVSSFMSKKLWDKVYKRGYLVEKIFWTILGLVQRILLIFSLRKYDCVYIFMNVFPFGPPLLERIYRIFCKKIIYDLEDNMLSDEPEGGNWIASLIKSKSKYHFLISTADEVIASSPYLVGKCKEITSKNIQDEIKIGNFREDLFHRLNVFNLQVEPLKNRLEDVPLLVEYFSEKISKNYNLKQFDLKNYISYLISYNWPGNVRELRNLIERVAILSPENSSENILNIVKESLKSTTTDVFDVNETLLVPLKEARENFEKEYLTTQLKKFGGNISKTAKFVGMERSALHRKLKILGVKGLN